ncbi:MAG: hypothetical protein ACXWCX_19915, partial [Burkholderiales bacterium]
NSPAPLTGFRVASTQALGQAALPVKNESANARDGLGCGESNSNQRAVCVPRLRMACDVA